MNKESEDIEKLTQQIRLISATLGVVVRHDDLSKVDKKVLAGFLLSADILRSNVGYVSKEVFNEALDRHGIMSVLLNKK